MFVFELVGENEDDPTYQKLAVANLARQYGFLESTIETAIALNRPMLSLELIQALNYHAIACLHAHAGHLRPCQVWVGQYTPPAEHRVSALLSILIEDVNRRWDAANPVFLAAYALWRLNWIHPFINGNGRTARVIAYYLICVSAGGLLPGSPTLPDLLRRDRDDYVTALQKADASIKVGPVDLSDLAALIQKLMDEQLAPFLEMPATP